MPGAVLGIAIAAGGMAVAIGADRACDDPLSLMVALHGGAELLDDADRLMADGGALATGYSPLRICPSVPQIVVVVIRTRASSGPTSGVGFSSRTIRAGSTNTAAFILDIVISLAVVLRGVVSRVPSSTNLACACNLLSGSGVHVSVSVTALVLAGSHLALFSGDWVRAHLH